MSTLREDILAAQDLPGQMVEVPLWDKTIWVRSPDAATAFRFTRYAGAKEGDKLEVEATDLAAVVINCACDPNTKLAIFKPGDEEAVLKKGLESLLLVFYAAMKQAHTETAEAEGN